MLHPTTVNAIIPLVEAYERLQVRLQPCSNTVISRVAAPIVSGFNSSLLQDITDPDAFAENLGGMIHDITSNTPDESSEHSGVADEAIQLIAGSIRRHIGFVKNVVVPVISEFSTVLNERLRTFEGPTAEGSIDIEQFVMPEPLSDGNLLHEIESSNNFPVSAPTSSIMLPDQSYESLLTHLYTGEGDLDDSIRSWIDRKGMGIIKDVWRTYLSPDTTDKSVNYIQDLSALPPADRLDYSLALFLLARKLVEAPDEIAENLGVHFSQFQKSLADVRDFAAANVRGAMVMVNNFSKGDILVISLTPNKKCVVYAPVYNTWLEQGGSPEVLMGLIVSGLQYRQKAIINEESGNLLAAWEAYRAVHRATSVANKFVHFKLLLETVFSDTIKQLTPEEQDYAINNPSYIENVARYFKEEMNDLEAKDMEDINRIVMKLVCRSRFYFTDAEHILVQMDEIARINPNLKPNEAALLATVDYIAEYLVDQICVVRK